MSDLRFEAPPKNGTSVTLTASGLETTPYRVTVTHNGELVKQLNFTSREDAQRVYDQEARMSTVPSGPNGEKRPPT